MAYINVDHSSFSTTANAIDEYVALMKKNMGGAQKEVTTLLSSWQGLDSTQFKIEWDKVTAEDSTYIRMVKSLEAYSKYLRHAEAKYKEAQSKAVNSANGLPKY